jgi:hypothetical protein
MTCLIPVISSRGSAGADVMSTTYISLMAWDTSWPHLLRSLHLSQHMTCPCPFCAAQHAWCHADTEVPHLATLHPKARVLM